MSADARQPMSQEYHQAHLAFARADIVEAAANRDPILGLLKAYTADVAAAVRDEIFEAAREGR